MTAQSIRSQRSTRQRPKNGQKQSKFVKTVLGFYKKSGRGNLPWRKTADPYKILVSEVMLQQTQVDRVIPHYKAFLKKFPTVRWLAAAPLSVVLRTWQGLGYNRRAKMLHDAAKAILEKYRGKLPKEKSALIALPGIGEYTAGAVRVFAFNEPEILLETNIRAAYLHHFFSRKKSVHDRKVLQLTVVPSGVEPREWYAALMDYGAHLKKTISNPSRRSAHHAKQKPFKDSNREIRGMILKALSRREHTNSELLQLPFLKMRIEHQLNMLEKEHLIARNARFLRLAD